jgi:hypothetical protein
VIHGELAVRKVTELTLTSGHRYLADAIKNPGSVLADM